MVFKREIVEYDADNGCYSLCACGCERPIFKGDDVIFSDNGLFLIGLRDRPKWDPKYYTRERVLEIIKQLSK